MTEQEKIVYLWEQLGRIREVAADEEFLILNLRHIEQLAAEALNKVQRPPIGTKCVWCGEWLADDDCCRDFECPGFQRRGCIS